MGPWTDEGVGGASEPHSFRSRRWLSSSFGCFLLLLMLEVFNNPIFLPLPLIICDNKRQIFDQQLFIIG